MAAANSTCPVSVSKNRHGQLLFDNPCRVCGKPRLSRRAKLGNMCRACAKEAQTVGGVSKHPAYGLWKSLRDRCENVKSVGYRYYGGRGICVCDEWRTDSAAFVAWAETHGYSPHLDLDRIDNDGPYAPWNCQFITHLANLRKCSKVKCTAEGARAVKVALASGQRVKEVAAAQGLSEYIVWDIKRDRTWRDA